MRKLRTFLVAFLVTGTMVFAHPRHKDGNKEKRNNYTPEQIATSQTKRLTLALDLSDKQAEQFMSLHLEHAKLREKQHTLRKSREEENRTKLTEEERYAMQNARLDQRIAFQKEVKKILSEEQFENWKKIRRHHGSKRHKMLREGERHSR